jgi:hypothetical protein
MQVMLSTPGENAYSTYEDGKEINQLHPPLLREKSQDLVGAIRFDRYRRSKLHVGQTLVRLLSKVNKIMFDIAYFSQIW